MNQQKQSPSTGESTHDEHQQRQEPARSDVTEKPDVSRSGAESSEPGGEPSRERDRKGPKSGGMGPKQ